jgi:hypothetical protein
MVCIALSVESRKMFIRLTALGELRTRYALRIHFMIMVNILAREPVMSTPYIKLSCILRRRQ